MPVAPCPGRLRARGPLTVPGGHQEGGLCSSGVHCSKSWVWILLRGSSGLRVSLPAVCPASSSAHPRKNWVGGTPLCALPSVACLPAPTRLCAIPPGSSLLAARSSRRMSRRACSVRNSQSTGSLCSVVTFSGESQRSFCYHLLISCCVFPTSAPCTQFAGHTFEHCDSLSSEMK